MVISLCSSLANKYSVPRNGTCPSSLQDPRGKIIPVSVMGVYPYIISGKDKKWMGGTEFEVTDVYAKKFAFTPKFVRATGFDGEGSVVEMVSKTSDNIS